MIDDDDDLDAGLHAAFDGDTSEPTIPDDVGPSSEPRGIAGYRLLAEIGSGGMGVVYEAEQQSPRRRVALKIIKQGMDTRQVVARFEQERQALALMDHPNIARVIDAGATDTGRPFFVMELVKGEPISEHCDKNRLSIEERLELFAQVCHAVQHAHSKGLIHRDIKPSNILVGSQDGKAVAKVIDFGIAKATAARLTERTLFTEHRQIIGTLQYMSPEQAEGSLDIDTRSDVYSLGVVLYELLTGGPPFDVRTIGGALLSEVQRQIREVDPPRPSTRLRDSTDTLADLAARRRLEPRRLTLAVHGELDWIAMKALEKDRARRYGSALELAVDVQRYLDGEAVAAAPPSRAYRLRKFARRNRAIVTGVAAVAVTLVLGMVGTAWQARIASGERDAAIAAQDAEAEQRRIAVAQRDSADQVAIFMAETLSGAAPSVALGRDTTILAEMMDRAAARITGGELAVAPEAELRLRLAIGKTYLDLSHFSEAERLLEPVLGLARSLHPGDSMETAHGLVTLGRLARARGDLTSAEARFRDGLAMLQRVHPGDHPRVASALHELAVAVRQRGRLDDAERLLRDSLAMTERLFPGDHEDRVSSLVELAQLLDDRGDSAAAEPVCRVALAMSERLHGPDHPQVALVRNNLAVSLLLQEKNDLALPLVEEALASLRRMHGNDSPFVAAALGNLAIVLQDHGEVARAEPLFREALAMDRRVFPGDHRTVARALDNLAKALMVLGQEDEAERLMTESVDMRRRLEPGDHPDLAIGLVNLARILAKRGRANDGEALVREALAMRRRLFPGPNDEVAAFLLELAHALVARREKPEAASVLREALAMHDVLHPGGTRQRAQCLVLLGSLLVDVGDAAGAEPLVREGCGIYAELGDAELLDALEAKSRLARLWWSRGELARSIPLFEEVLAARAAKLGRRDARTLETIANLGVNYQDAGRMDRSLPLLEEAHAAAAASPSVAWVSNPLLDAYVRSGRGEDAAALVPDVLAWMRGALSPDDPEVAARLHWLGERMAAVAQWKRAEALFRECVAQLERAVPDHWRRFEATCLLGEALLQQGDHAAAEPLLRAGYDGLLQRETSIPQPAATVLRDEADRLVRLYESWARAAPEDGHDTEAATWRATRDGHALRVPAERR